MALNKPITSYFNQLVYAIGNYHFNWHEELELQMVISGQMTVNVEGTQYQLKTNDLLLINSNQSHATQASKPGVLAIRTHIDPAFFDEQGLNLEDGQFQLHSSLIPVNPVYAGLRSAIAALYLAKTEFDQNSACFRLADLLYHHFFTATQSSKTGKTQQRSQLENLAAYIEKNYQKPLTLGKLANRYGYSRPYFSKICKQQFGIPLKEYLTRERLRHSVNDLNDTNLKISTIAYQNGFAELKSFNQAFKKHFGITPSVYRGEHDADLEKMDFHFKRDLSPEQEELAKRLLRKQLDQQRHLSIDEICQNCAFRQDSASYQQLKKNLKKLLDEN